MFAAIALLQLASFVSSTCTTAGPVSLLVTDVKLSNNHVMRGFPMTVGTPPQNISFMPHHYLNDTWIYNSTNGFCVPDTGDTSEAFCTTYRGGLYNLGASTTYDAASTVYEAGGDPSDIERALGTHIWVNAWANDVLSFKGISLPDFALGMPGWDFGGNFDTQSVVGLGVNSTLLSALEAAGKISSKSWSWWWGQTGATEDVQMDGSIVFGGYDKAKTVGDRYTQKLTTNALGCPSGMSVSLTDVVLNFPNGTQSSMLSPNQLSACLQPDFTYLISLPESPYYDNFEDLTQTSNLGRAGGHGLGAAGMVYRPDEVYQGSITIELNGAFSVEVPNSLFVVPPRTITQDGSIFTNTSFSAVLLNPTANVNAGDNAILGRPFFSAAYAYIDHDAWTYSLWQANPTDQEDLKVFGGGCSNSEPTPSPNNTDTSKPKPSTSHSNQAAHAGVDNLSIAAIAGIVVGGVVGIGLIAAILATVCVRKRRNQRVAQQYHDAGRNQPRSYLNLNEGWGYRQSRHGMKFSEAMSSDVVEMSGQSDPQEVAGRERPAEIHSSFRKNERYRPYLAANNSPVELD